MALVLCGAWAYLPQSVWDLSSRPGTEPVSSALEGRVLTTGPQRKSPYWSFCFSSSVYFWLPSGLAAWGLSLAAASRESASRESASLLQHSGFSPRWLLLLQGMGSSSLSQGLQLLCSAWNPPRPEIEPCPLHRQGDSRPLDHQERPHCWSSREPNFGSVDFLSCFFYPLFHLFPLWPFLFPCFCLFWVSFSLSSF